jgi:MFS family permease
LLFIYNFSFKNITETPEFIEAQNQNALLKLPIILLWNEHKKSIMVIATYAAFMGVALYVGHIYFISFLVNYANYSLSLAAKIGGYTELGLTILIPIFGLIAQKYNCYRIFFIFGVSIMGIIGPFLFLVGSLGPNSFIILCFVIAVYIISDSLFSVSIFFYIYQQLPVYVRGTGTGLAYNISIAFFGGTAPIVSDFLIRKSGMQMPGFYMLLASFITLIVFMSTKNKNPSIYKFAQ